MVEWRPVSASSATGTAAATRTASTGTRRDIVSYVEELAGNTAAQLRAVFATRVVGPEYPSVVRVRGLYIKNIMLRFERTEAISQAKTIIMEIGDKVKSDKQFSPLQIHFDVDPQ